MDIVKKDIGGNAEAEVVLYQPDSSIHIEVLVEGETVWLTQQQIADLFGTKRPAITKHLNDLGFVSTERRYEAPMCCTPGASK